MLLALGRGLAGRGLGYWRRSEASGLRISTSSWVAWPTSDEPAPASLPIRQMLLYSSELDDVYDTTLTRNTAVLVKQEATKLEVENNRLRSFLRARPEDNLSLALPFVYDGLGYVQRGGTVAADSIEEWEHVGDEVGEGANSQESKVPTVFPFGLFQDTSDQFRARLASATCYGRKRPQRASQRRRLSSAQRNENGREDFEVISDNLEPDRAKKTLSEDEMFRYGTADATVAVSDVPCGGCGAILHCQDTKMPGFMPSELFKGKSKARLRASLCQRCYVMREYNIALKMNVSPEDYPRTIAHVSRQPAVVLIIIDLLDFPGCVWPGIVDLLGPNKRIVLVGNKVDLLPHDSPGTLARVEKSMKTVFLEKCSQGRVKYDPRVVSTILVSARTGYNIEALITKIYKSWSEDKYYLGGDIYLIGTTNVGKSSIFNALLDSDLCKVNAIDKVERAMTSPVPGTTLNLLKFPIMRPDPSRIYQRITRLRQDNQVMLRNEKERLGKLQRLQDRSLAIRSGIVGQTFKSDKHLPLTGIGFELQTKLKPGTSLPQRLDPMHNDFADGKWCYDTPGTVSHEQVINLLTQEEISRMLPVLPLRPRTFALRKYQSLFLGGIARLDLIDGPFRVHPLIVTVFCSDGLPINIVRTSDAEAFYKAALGTDVLAVPMGEEHRLSQFPALQGLELDIDGISKLESSCDIVLSSAGWVTCLPGAMQLCRVKAWTPDAKGIFVREPPFLPFAHQLRGKRVAGTPAYRCDKIFIA